MNRLFKTIVIDDEPAARRLMKSLLSDYADTIDVIAEAGNGREAIEKIHALRPDLIFLDIQMPDLTGFEVIEQLDYKPNIIFTTAYEQYAIKAFESFSIDYLLKPIKEERLEQSIRKLNEFGKISGTGPGIDVTGLQDIIRQLQAPPKLQPCPSGSVTGSSCFGLNRSPIWKQRISMFIFIPPTGLNT